MGIYSHSKISTFEQCKYKYKLAYIDMIRSDVQSIESFMGSLVHQTLERLYRDLNSGKLNSKDELIRHYLLTWSQAWHSAILIAKEGLNQEYYQNMGLTFILEYYDKYFPFDQLKTIDVETDEKLNISKKDMYYIKIDRLAKDESGNYYVIDYKTGNGIKSQKDLDSDRQLAMYSIWVKEKYSDAKNVFLMWNFLAFNEERLSMRSDEDLRRIKEEVKSKIVEIESCNEFEPNITKLCNYCEYKTICPAWKESSDNGEKFYQQKILRDFTD